MNNEIDITADVKRFRTVGTVVSESQNCFSNAGSTIPDASDGLPNTTHITRARSAACKKREIYEREYVGDRPKRPEAYLSPDEKPWLQVAEDVVAGQYTLKKGSSLVASLEIGLRSIQHPICRQALALLPGVK